MRRFFDCGGHYSFCDRGMTESRGETFNLRIRLDLELLSYELLVKARLLDSAGAVAGGGERQHEFFRRASRKWIGIGEPPPPGHTARVVARLGRGVGKEFDCCLILASKSSSLAVNPRFELPTVGEMKSVEQRPLVAV